MTQLRDDLPKQTARDRRAIVEEAGYPRVSFLSVLAGTLTAYGAFAIVAAIAGAILDATDADTDFSTNDWTSSGAIGGLATGIVLLVAYLFGGYVAGRMARRAGLLHGIGVALLSVVGGGLLGALIGWIADDQTIEDNLGSIGVPTNWDDWGAVAVATAIVALAAIVVGSILGALYGERWHARLLRRAADPSIGPLAAARRDMEDRERERDELVEREAFPGGAGRSGDGRADDQEVIDLREQDRLREEQLQELDRRTRAREEEWQQAKQQAEQRRAEDLEQLDRRNGEPAADGSRDEPRYTAAEWQAIQQQQADRARSVQRF